MVEMDPYLTDLLETVALKQWERHINAVEPAEQVFDLMPLPTTLRGRKIVDNVEMHFRAGEELFETELSLLPGFGDGMGGKSPNMHRVHRGAHGGPDTSSCRSCHHRGGDDGSGEYTEAALIDGDGEHASSATERNPPALHGGGVMQILAREITSNLQTQLHREPKSEPVYVTISYDDVIFGTVVIMPDGRIDTRDVKSIDPDFVVRPFGWKGTHSTLRRFAEEAFQVHHGLQSTALVQQRRLFGPLPQNASPATRALMGQLGRGKGDDPDEDNASQDIAGSQITAMAVYLTLLPMPVIEPPRSPDLLAAWREGMATFTEIGCADCHKPKWKIFGPTSVEHGEDATSEGSLSLDLTKDIRNGPSLRNRDLTASGYQVFVFSDLRRHDMGPELADRTPTERGLAPHVGDHVGPNIPASYFLTRPLWGLADSGPYLHDGRASTIHEAILAHGGEAEQIRNTYRTLPPERQRALQIFLFSLTRPMLPEVTP